MNQYRVVFKDDTRMLVTARHIDSAEYFAKKKMKKSILRIDTVVSVNNNYNLGIWNAETGEGNGDFPFDIKITCKACGEEVENMARHLFTEECFEHPANRKRRAEQNRKAEKQRKESDISWEKWGADDKLEYARYDWDYLPRQIAHKGKCVFVYGNRWASEGKEYKTKVLTNPTYGTVMKHFDKAIALTGDHHHIFFEGLTEIKKHKGVTTYEIIAGS